ncbi:UNVERIFIED_CONTAM: hypothetical protein Sradi_2752700 [Sesamum radiatum]|uniref:Uncharacterized protein n=1 Tax=Sesamum radiatum TaxID=300843 RepID=A0AAW2S8E9_SESRA
MESPKTEKLDNNAGTEHKATEAPSTVTSQADSYDMEARHMVANPGSSKRSSDLTLQIPPRPVGLAGSRSGKYTLQSPGVVSGSSPTGGFLGAFSFKKRSTGSDSIRSSLLSSDPKATPESPDFSNHVTNLNWKRCTSLPVTPASNLSPHIIVPASASEGKRPYTGESQATVSRSLSVPGRNVFIVRSQSFAARENHAPETDGDCAIKWFSLKGNRECEVCGKEVSNLPVTLLRVANAASKREPRNEPEYNEIQDMKNQALILAAPFSFTLALTASIFAVVLAIKEYIWTFAALEFALVALTLHFFYSLLHLPPIYAILISSFMGLGIAVLLNSLYMKVFSWRVHVPQSSNPA